LVLLKKIKNIISENRYQHYVSQSLARASVLHSSRRIDPSSPDTWEFSGFSQNGEDGIIDYLVENLIESDRYFIEIGASLGIDNNTAWLAIAKKFSGLMIEGSFDKSSMAQKLISPHNIGVNCINMFVDKDSVTELRSISLTDTPDFFSLDIDGNDYYLMRELLSSGFRPKIIAAEFNSAFGPEKSITITYDKDFEFDLNGGQYLYYGVSIQAWRQLLCGVGYKFVTVEKNGVNGFFIWPTAFNQGFVDAIKGVDFRENFFQLKKYKMGWEQQFQLISHRDFFEVL